MKNILPLTNLNIDILRRILHKSLKDIRKFGGEAMKKNREKFVSLAEKRTVKAIKSLRLIGNLSNKSNYSYDENDVKKIINALENEIKVLKLRFESTPADNEVSFKL